MKAFPRETGSMKIAPAACWPVCPPDDDPGFHSLVAYLIHCGVDVAFGPDDSLPTELPDDLGRVKCILLMSRDLERHRARLKDFLGFNARVDGPMLDADFFSVEMKQTAKLLLHRNRRTWLMVFDSRTAFNDHHRRKENPLILGADLEPDDPRMGQRMLARSDAELHARFIEGLLTYTRTDWGDIPLGVGKALLEAHELTGARRLLAKAIRTCARLLAHEPTFWSVHNVTPFYAFAKLFAITGDRRLLDIMPKHIARAFASEAFRKNGPDAPRVFLQSDGFMSRATRDALDPETGGAGTYSDLAMTNYMPLMAAGRVLGRAREFADRILPCALEFDRHLLDEKTGLYHQGTMGKRYGHPGITGQGSHWVIFGLAHLLEDAPRDHPLYPRVLEQFRRACEAVCRCQDQEGAWHHILNMPFTPFARIYTASFTHALLRGVRLGLLDDPFRENGLRGWRALKKRLFRHTVLGQDGGTPNAKRFEFYLMQPLTLTYQSQPHCKIFWAAHALHEVLRLPRAGPPQPWSGAPRQKISTCPPTLAPLGRS